MACRDGGPRWTSTHVIDTSGAYIPGHGTPTVILFGGIRPAVAMDRPTVMGIQGEPSTPGDRLGARVAAIVRQVDQAGAEERIHLGGGCPAEPRSHSHPWSHRRRRGGGAEGAAMNRLERQKS